MNAMQKIEAEFAARRAQVIETARQLGATSVMRAGAVGPNGRARAGSWYLTVDGTERRATPAEARKLTAANTDRRSVGAVGPYDIA